MHKTISYKFPRSKIHKESNVLHKCFKPRSHVTGSVPGGTRIKQPVYRRKPCYYGVFSYSRRRPGKAPKTKPVLHGDAKCQVAQWISTV